MRELRYNASTDRWEWRVDGRLIFTFDGSADDEEIGFWRSRLSTRMASASVGVRHRNG